jgi:hypothetical protein
MTTVAIQITEESLPLITVLNGGVTPLLEATENYYFLCDIAGNDVTENHRIISYQDFYRMHDNAPESYKVHHWNK